MAHITQLLAFAERERQGVDAYQEQVARTRAEEDALLETERVRVETFLQEREHLLEGMIEAMSRAVGGVDWASPLRAQLAAGTARAATVDEQIGRLRATLAATLMRLQDHKRHLDSTVQSFTQLNKALQHQSSYHPQQQRLVQYGRRICDQASMRRS